MIMMLIILVELTNKILKILLYSICNYLIFFLKKILILILTTLMKIKKNIMCTIN